MVATPTPTQTLQWETVALCDHCGSAEQRVFLESPKPKWFEDRQLRLVECGGCGLVFASPRPVIADLLATIVGSAEDAQAAMERKLARKNVRAIHKKHIETAIGRLGYSPRRIFDMGCGAGTLMMEAQDMGLEAHGNDVNRVAVETLRQQGLAAHLGCTNDLDLPEQSFDIVFCLDYLEHTYTPMDDLRYAFKLLRPGGLLYLKTLYLGSPGHLENGDAWHLFCNEHFYFFYPSVLRRMVEHAGFELIEVTQGTLIFVLARRRTDQG
ncbi:MAG: class I SAM-dependent methyltransferase [Hyphomicrobiaceae bacterium]|nr:class I SAM-dependent methyltransferase [Hyphomicrobiaceae bacterium]